ncbi:Ff.00g099930.m01.CDS01 [Fusarium sp. VM40]|nr:Ff.00g099930.m01.CDS01 [Fusarium sp. VM40]
MHQVFQPQANQENLFSFDKTPTYLFRLHFHGSNGCRTSDCVESPAFPNHLSAKYNWGSPCGTDLLQLSSSEAAARLKAHLGWKCCNRGRKTCNLMSWSSSLLFLLQYGFHRHQTDPKKKGGPRPKLADIKIIILDTRDFPKQVFLRDLDALKWLDGEPDLRRLHNLRKGRHYFGEYLSQGRLDIKGNHVQISMQQLIDGGLFTSICPALNQPQNWSSWANITINLRGTILQNNSVDKRRIRKTIFLAQSCVGDKFVVPFALMLLCLRSGPSDDEMIANAFHSIFTDKELEFQGIRYDLESKRMTELGRFQQLMEAVKKVQIDDPIAKLTEGVKALSTN